MTDTNRIDTDAPPVRITNWDQVSLFLDEQELLAVTGLTARAAFRRAKHGRFPAPRLKQPPKWAKADLQRWAEGSRQWQQAHPRRTSA